MFTIGKKFTFCAAHHLPHLPPEHKCARPHGHNYVVYVELDADTLDNDGFVLDYGELNAIRNIIDAEYDHRDLNKIFTLTTAEFLAVSMYNRFQKVLERKGFRGSLIGVRVSETENTYSEYRPTF